MKELVYLYIRIGEQYWWAFLIIWLLLILVAHIPNFVDFRYLDLKIPSILLFVWLVLELLKLLCVI